MNEKIENYLSKIDRSPRTIETYSWALSYYVDLVGEDFNDEDYEKFLESIKHLSPSSKRVLRSAVVGLYEFYEIGDPAKRAKLNRVYMKKVKTKPVNFDREAIEKIIKYCEEFPKKTLADWRDRAFVLMLADSGFRISELCGLDRSDIDWLNQRVVIVGKGDKLAIVRLSKRAASALTDYLTVREANGMYDSKKEPLFAQHGNVSTLKKMTNDGMRKAIKQRMGEAGARVRIHDFRHYFVTVTLLSTNNLKAAQVLARHESMRTTEKYAHLADAEIDKIYDEVFNK